VYAQVFRPADEHAVRARRRDPASTYTDPAAVRRYHAPVDSPLQTVLPAAPPPLPEPASPAAAPRAPRVWTVFVAYGVVFLGMLAAGAVVLVVALVVRTAGDPGALRAPGRILTEAVAALASGGVQIGSLFAGSLVQLAGASLAARLSPEPTRARLALGPSTLGPGGLAVAVLGCLALSSTFDAAFGALGLEQAGSISQFGRVLAGLSRGALAPMLLAGAVLAPAAEEIFFRGYAQTRLCRRWGTAPGILTGAALFGLAHLDWIHTPSAFVIGVYLGWLVHRTGSVRPAILAHAVNNAAWVLATWAGLGSSVSRGAHAALLALYVAAVAAAIAWLRGRTAPSAPASGLTAP
jgi:membrane protease YdiL (CAAX protease family)